MRNRSYKSGYELESAVILFANRVRDCGKPVGVRFDGEWLKRRPLACLAEGDPFFIGVYDPTKSTFSLEELVADILAAFDEMGVRVESEKV